MPRAAGRITQPARKTAGQLDARAETPPEPAGRWAVEAVLSVCPLDETPDLLFDVGAVWPAKREALACYATQFTPAPGARPTMINDPSFLEEVERWARGWGFRAGVEMAEALRTEAAPVLTDLPEERWA